MTCMKNVNANVERWKYMLGTFNSWDSCLRRRDLSGFPMMHCKMSGSNNNNRIVSTNQGTKIFQDLIHEKYQNMSPTLTQISTCQVVCWQGGYFFCFCFITSTSSTCYYSYAMVRRFCRHLPTKDAYFIHSNQLMETQLNSHIVFVFIVNF